MTKSTKTAIIVVAILFLLGMAISTGETNSRVSGYNHLVDGIWSDNIGEIFYFNSKNSTCKIVDGLGEIMLDDSYEITLVDGEYQFNLGAGKYPVLSEQLKYVNDTIMLDDGSSFSKLGSSNPVEESLVGTWVLFGRDYYVFKGMGAFVSDSYLSFYQDGTFRNDNDHGTYETMYDGESVTFYFDSTGSGPHDVKMIDNVILMITTNTDTYVFYRES